MGTRCDFYIMKKKPKLIWMGSYGWDGYPSGEPEGMGLHKVNNEEDFKSRILSFLEEKQGYIAGKDGWPWPWDNSKTTDFYYIFFEGKVYVSCFGGGLIEINDYLENEEKINDEEDIDKLIVDLDYELPDMSKIKKVDLGKSSGIITIGGFKNENIKK